MMITEVLRNKTNFSNVDSQIADYMLHADEHALKQSARDIARELFISPSTLTRFSQKIGYSGINDFLSALIEEKVYLSTHFTSIDANFPFEKKDSNYRVAGKISCLYKEIIEDTYSLLHYEMLDKAVHMLYHAENIYIVAAGISAEAGNMFQDKMAKIHKKVSTIMMPDIAYSYAMMNQPKDIFIILSYSGETGSIIKTASLLHQQNRSFIAITSYGQNSLTALTDCVLEVSTREKLNRGIGSYSMNLSVMYLLDVLYSCYFRYDYNHNLEKKYSAAKGYQDARKSYNPILSDD